MSFFRKIGKALRCLPDPLFRRALFQGVSPSHEHRAMLKSLGKLNTIVDVGANVGQFALLASRVQPAAIIHSFEPLSDAAKKFLAVIGENPQVRLHRCALGVDDSVLNIHVTSQADSSSLLSPKLQADYFPGTHLVRTEEVVVHPLHAVVSREEIRSPALLKIDVQGFEAQVLEGCGAVLSSFDWVFVELSFVELYSGQTLAPEIIDWLHARNFELFSVYTDPNSYKNGLMVQGDFLFKARA